MISFFDLADAVYVLVFVFLFYICIKETKAWKENKEHHDYRSYREKERDYWQKEQERKRRKANKSFDNSARGNSSNQYDFDRDINGDTNLFSGMTRKDARKLKCELLKKYHPDNKGGSQDITLKILEDYREVFG